MSKILFTLVGSSGFETSKIESPPPENESDTYK